ncbi:MAG: HlyD family efflux transporter periplasmic adaptor subunit [Candidatus Eisenbacteria bacterium]|uniref:HlyD family efflux transporter periplasmic adaptor subunit n=1 Tax=Eiseniibacteriota bacterium TaxID=2212470 RepID=A0A538UBU4_UNCEI|nr:MAG: HlyD family efflux transporter periplasmic adaptor subunit [Candidatus Eisenbacteria bacterium]
MNQPLFRPEVLAERQTQWLGTVLLAPRLSYRLFATFAAFAILAMVALLFVGTYTRKAHIVGWLVPSLGLVQVFAPQTAVVSKIAVTEGSEVHKGDRLLVLSTELQSSARGATQSAIAGRLEARRSSLSEGRQELERLGVQREQSLAERLSALGVQLAELDSSVALQTERVRIARDAEARQREIHARGLISDREFQAATEGRLDQESHLRELTRSRAAAKGEYLTLQGELQDQPLQSRTDVANVDREIAQVEQDLAEVESRREIMIPAPESGTVTSIQAENGGRADPKVPLMTLVPAGSTLEAHLFSPSRSIGFLRPGQRVVLQFEAYPSQKFGTYEGVVTSISRSSINPGELPTQIAGLTRLTGSSSEPVYRITVGLKRQSVSVYGRAVPLQPGMLLEADVLIERRRLVDWILDPVYRITRSHAS